MKKKIICWWSGGVTSAVACKITIDLYGKDSCLVVFIDTKNEDDDTYRFKDDCEKWYGLEIHSIGRVGKGMEYESIKDVWYKFKSLNVAHGAICSSELKRAVREEFQKSVNYLHQVFGFDMSEPRRAKSMTANYSEAKPIYPLLLYGLYKKDCIKIIQDAGIKVPDSYEIFHNNNCLKTGCVQGGIGYWQLMKIKKPDVFREMAKVEHDLTNMKGKPVTMLKDQSKEAKESGNYHVFLMPHPDYPHVKDISMMNGRKPEPLMECNGFCGTNDLNKRRNPTELEINFES